MRWNVWERKKETFICIVFPARSRFRYSLRLAQSRRFDAIICLGTIIRGQTPHFDYIANEVARGISHAA